ncbi:MAG: acyl-CoA thioesterase [Pirellula sp.]|jgi:acyl-CoA thioester hydrolase
MSAFSFERRVEFCETDSAGIAHFSSLAIYMEQAEHALFRSLGLTVFPPQSSTNTVESGSEREKPLDVTWPRVHISLDFLGPACFEEILKIEVVIARLGGSSVTFEHVIHGPKHLVARGTSVSVCCKIDRSKSHELIKLPIPQLIRDKLTTYLRP